VRLFARVNLANALHFCCGAEALSGKERFSLYFRIPRVLSHSVVVESCFYLIHYLRIVFEIPMDLRTILKIFYLGRNKPEINTTSTGRSLSRYFLGSLIEVGAGPLRVEIRTQLGQA
jgi:hypothetical protein